MSKNKPDGQHSIGRQRNNCRPLPREQKRIKHTIISYLHRFANENDFHFPCNMCKNYKLCEIDPYFETCKFDKHVSSELVDYIIAVDKKFCCTIFYIDVQLKRIFDKITETRKTFLKNQDTITL